MGPPPSPRAAVTSASEAPAGPRGTRLGRTGSGAGPGLRRLCALRSPPPESAVVGTSDRCCGESRLPPWRLGPLFQREERHPWAGRGLQTWPSRATRNSNFTDQRQGLRWLVRGRRAAAGAGHGSSSSFLPNPSDVGPAPACYSARSHTSSLVLF